MERGNHVGAFFALQERKGMALVLTALASKLGKLVDRIELVVRDFGVISEKDACELRDLRVRTEQLLLDESQSA